MRYLVTIVLMFCLLQTTAQNNKIEAIRKELQKQTAADTFRVKSFIKLAESTMSLNMDTALKAITEGIQIVQKFNYPPLTGICYKTKADIFFTYSMWDSESSLNKYRESNTFKDIWSKTKPLFSNKAKAWSVEEI